MGRRSVYKAEPNFLQTNPEYLRLYNELQKEMRTWDGMGQYWLAKEAERRSNALLQGNLDEYSKQRYSHELFHKTKKFM